MDDPAGVPSGLSGVLGDFAHYCRVHGAETVLDKLLLPFRAPALVALATYRLGRWVYTSPRLNRRTSLPFRAVFAGASEVVRHATGVLIHPWSEIERDVWFASFAPIIVGARRIRAGSMIHGCVTLGVGGARGARGVPIIGSNVTVGPGAAIVGPVDVPDGSVIGPNTLLTSSPAKASTWLGSPAMKSKRPTGSMLPAELL